LGISLTFNDGWLFAKDEPKGFVPVRIPHDWLICDTRNLYKSGVGWYKKTFDAGSLDGFEDDSLVFLRFDGVYMDCELFVNNKSAGEWKYGYTAFEFDVTGFIDRKGMNTLLLRVNYLSQSSRWYTGAGIYRDVFLKIKNPAHIVSDGIYVTPRKLDGGRWIVEAEAEIRAGGRDYEVKHSVVETGGLIIDNPLLWDIDAPNLYHLKTELIIGGAVVDSEITRFGLRETAFTTDKGFFLNGRRVKLNGVCMHHDLGALGAAFDKGAARRQLEILRGMGVNAIRTAHNPPAAAFMELADSMGFLVMSELLDIWRLPKNANDYARFFDDWVERDAAAWLRRDRNCPSVIMWSVGNEIYDTHADAETGGATLRMLMGFVKRHDPKDHAIVTFCSNYMPWENTQICADIIKTVGYNYAENLYKEHHDAHPDWIIYGAETCSTAQSRGVYHFPLAKSVLADDDLQCSALGNSRTSWGAASVERCINDDAETGFSLGQFVWAGFDYIGEPTPYHSKSSYLGHVDTAGFPKDSYYIFKAAWTDYKAEPFVHVYPYWDFSPGQIVDVRVCSNAPMTELFLNGVSLGKGKDFRVAYEPGELLALAYDGNGKEIARAARRSFGDAVSLKLENRRYDDLIFCEITAWDAAANPVENANNRVNVSVSGGTLLGMDNGDSTDYDQYTAHSRRMFNGKLLAVVRPDGDDCVITAEIDNKDVPVRKIELTADGFDISAKLFPAGAAYKDLVWRLTDVSGIDSPLGSLSAAGDNMNAVIIPRGDGEVFIRCGVKNGGEHVALYSQISLTINGYGKPLIDPYSFVSGGLYSRSNTELGNGNERGVVTLRTGESHVGFADIDFGKTGADEITLWLFPLNKEPFSFGIWEGMPGEGGELLCSPRYDKGSVWNTYQDVTYKLPKRLFGVKTLCLTFDQKVHIKGFVFKRLERAFEKLYAAQNDGIYGDSFIIGEHAIEHIGNNVTIAFNDLDFGAEGAAEAEVSWRADRKNSFQIAFTDACGETVSSMIELASTTKTHGNTKKGEEYQSARFAVGRRVTGVQTVRLIFLPGCEMDLEYIRFDIN
jgi:beta-galactosidase